MGGQGHRGRRFVYVVNKVGGSAIGKKKVVARRSAARAGGSRTIVKCESKEKAEE